MIARTLASLVLAAASSAQAPSPPRPNIVVVLSDDMGYSDIGCYGGEIETPNLDALAADGLRFTQFYNTGRCCPTRASLLTGLHPHQAGVGHMMEDRGHEGYRGRLGPQCVTLAQVLAPAGYRCYAVGKWHVTPATTADALADKSNWPLQRGFQRYYGTIHGAGSYFDPSSLVRDNEVVTVASDGEYQPQANGAATPYYYTDAIADHAVRFVREHARDHAGEPFFLYVAFTAAHWPLHAKAADRQKYAGRYDGGYEPVRAARRAKMQQLGLLDEGWPQVPPAERWGDVRDPAFERRCMEVYAAQIDCMDQGVGRLVTELKARGCFDDTLFFYLQDNGACAEATGRGDGAKARGERPSLPPMAASDTQIGSRPKQTRDGWPVRSGYGVMPGDADTYVAYGRGWANVSNTPFREYKHWVHEGGIATPLVVHWPNGVPAARRGTLEAQPGQLVDVMATCVDVAGATYPEQIGDVAITPMEGASLQPAFAGRSIARTRPLVWEHEGNRAVRDGAWKLVAKEGRPWELYDVVRDRGEMHDVAAEHRDRVQAMAATWQAWAERANVLPLGAWRGRVRQELSKETRFELGAGAVLARGEAPPIAGRGFSVTVRFTVQDERDGVLMAHGGSAHGYALFLREGVLHFVARTGTRMVDVGDRIVGRGAHTARAHLDATGRVSLVLDGGDAARADLTTPITTMPTDGLQVGRDAGGLVGPYARDNAFGGKIERVYVDIDP
ncbi:MAG: arylsulfatase [Planctomycetota bacterium]